MQIVNGSRRGARVFPRQAIAGLFAAMLTLTTFPPTADASTGPYSRIKSICLRERVVLRPEKRANAVETETDGSEKRMRMLRVSYCDLRRPACFTGEAEVSMTICKPG